ncbi:hypothetical protein B0H19DRAFT_1080347 [Mycena capillaripes]|nr:hypothetical protein B0H19DRAFT_1080347 [Mycena capillaripes]
MQTAKAGPVLEGRGWTVQRKVVRLEQQPYSFPEYFTSEAPEVERNKLLLGLSPFAASSGHLERLFSILTKGNERDDNKTRGKRVKEYSIESRQRMIAGKRRINTPSTIAMITRNSPVSVAIVTLFEELANVVRWIGLRSKEAATAPQGYDGKMKRMAIARSTIAPGRMARASAERATGAVYTVGDAIRHH